VTSIATLIYSFSHEGPREVLIGFACGVGVTVVLSWLGHHHLVKPARRRHAEVMAAQHKTHRHLGIEEET
jgi:hypothetical protein